jgi:hypothetical protein
LVEAIPGVAQSAEVSGSPVTLRRFAKKRDANEPAFRDELAACGWLTQPLSIKDWPDLLCARAGKLVLCEVKSKHGKLKPGQTDVLLLLAMFEIEVIVARTSEEFLRKVAILR